MMFRHGVGFVPRLTRRVALPPAHEVVLFAAGHPMLGTASGHGTLTIQIEAPALHAGAYQIAISSLAGGPVCLVPPILHHDADAGTLTATPGLWAADLVYGAPSVQPGWLADGAPLADAGALLTLGPSHAGQAIRHSETVAQGGLQAVALSDAFDVPGTGDPEPEPGEFALRTTADATLEAELANAQPVTVTVTEPADQAGSYTLDPAALAQGPVCLIPPRLEGLAVAGQELRLIAGLWTHDLAAAPMTVARQWRRDGAPFAHEGAALTLTEAHRGRTISVVETAQDGHGTVIAATPARHVPQPGEMPDTFSAPDGTLLAAYLGESGLGWSGGATIQNGRLRTSTANLYNIAQRDQTLPANQFAEGIIVIGTAPSDSGVGLVVRGDAAGRTGYFLRRNAASWIIGALVNGTVAGAVSDAVAYPAGTEVAVRLEVRNGSDLRLIVNGSTLRSLTHGSAISSGRPGALVRGNAASGMGTELTQFHAGALA